MPKNGQSVRYGLVEIDLQVLHSLYECCKGNKIILNSAVICCTFPKNQTDSFQLWIKQFSLNLQWAGRLYLRNDTKRYDQRNAIFRSFWCISILLFVKVLFIQTSYLEEKMATLPSSRAVEIIMQKWHTANKIIF